MKNLKPELSLLDEGYILSSPLQIYTSYFKQIPSEIEYENLEIKKLIVEFPLVFKKQILKYHFAINKSDSKEVGRHIFILQNEILVEIVPRALHIYFNEESAHTRKIEKFITNYKKSNPELAQINLITMQQGDFQNRKIDFEKPKIELDQLYNNDFTPCHHKMLNTLNEKNTSGLHLLYGIPGTGKSTYIRYLCSILKKKVIFLPGQLAQNLDNVYMTRYLISNSNSILVIEDAEELIVSRDHKRNSNLAMILNMTDGILGESLGIQIIATFNTDFRNIDPALKRKGRLKSSYEFKALEVEKANHLLQKEGLEETTATPLTLAEIYNFKEEQEMKDPARKAVGFR
ncbi:AAA family ATPase [Gramella sp. KN1008]|uniref:AAA family ATPase n=1 Tax=Gramella sp. KN1008 TaxID=2529298 RepID=UPI00103AF29B|nr:AAA family ATPase [Gramella sp. KN1008]TBW30252.1 AAA family ATPase [Gramella sp. KN1008]